jgi:hypothetical protein
LPATRSMPFSASPVFALTSMLMSLPGIGHRLAWERGQIRL